MDIPVASFPREGGSHSHAGEPWPSPFQSHVHAPSTFTVPSNAASGYAAAHNPGYSVQEMHSAVV